MFLRKLIALTALGLMLLVQRPFAQGPTTAKIYMVDIGQGAATLIVSPTGKTLLMDGGPPGSGNGKIVPLLNSLGISRLDFAVLSHYHIDHVSGLTELIQAGKMGAGSTAYDNGDGPTVVPPGTATSGSSTRGTYLNYVNAVTNSGTTRQTIAPGTVIDLGGGMRATAMAAGGVLLSGGAVPITNDDLNMESISLFVEYNNFDFVVAGDLTGGGSTSTNKTPDIESHVGQMIGDVDIVQLSHHGSTTTSSQLYLSTIKAEVALAQTGFTNTFGHPNRETVNKYLNTPVTNGNVFSGTGAATPGVAPAFYQQEASPAGDDRVTQQGISSVTAANSGQGTVLIQTDGTSSYSLMSFEDGGVKIPPALHTYPMDGAANGVTTNFPPTVIVSPSPMVPLSTDAVTIAALINDREDPIAAVSLTYALNGVAQTPISMTLAGPSTYQGAIPPQPDGTRVDYAVSAVAGGRTTSYALGYFSGTTPVASLHVLNAKGEPQFTGYPARIVATVTAGSGTFAAGTNDDYAQDATGGIDLFKSTETATIFTSTSPGQLIEARGRVGFNGGRFRLDLTEVIGVTVSPFGITLVSNGAAPSPLAVSIAAINANPELFEGQLVSIANATRVSGTFPTSSQTLDAFVTITDGSGNMTLKIDKDTDVDGFSPGASFPVTGIIQQDDFLRPFDGGYNVTPRSRIDLGGVPASAVLMPIGDARADLADNDDGAPGADTIPDRIGQLVRVRGVVTSIDFRGGNGIEYYIQDSTGGVDLFSTTINVGPFNVGDSVEAVGTVTLFNGLTELSIAALSDVTLLPAGTVAAAAPQVVTIAQLTASPGAESLEGRLIRVNNVSITAGTFPAAGASANVTITDVTGSMVLRVDSDTNIDGTSGPSATFSVIALASQFDSTSPFDEGYQILPRSTADLIVTTPSSLTAAPSTVSFGTVTVGTSAPSSVTLSNAGGSTITLSPPFSISGTDVNQFTVGAPGTTTLAAGASTVVAVNFAPTTAGSKSATLTITSSDGDTATVALSGSGQAALPPATQIVISEFRFVGPNGGNDEFVEIYNNTDSPINIGGYRLNGSNSAGTTSTRATVPAGVTIPARGHFLFANSLAYSGTVPANQTYGTGITADGGIAILLPSPSTTIVDQVGLSAGSAYKEGTALASLTTNTNRGYERKNGGAAGSTVDTGNNATDFQLLAPSDPQNVSSAPTPSPVVPQITATPSSLAFGSIAVGSSSSSPVTITNVGSSTANLSTPFVISGASANQFTVGAPGTTTLVAGASTSANVSFAPTSAASHSATLTITSSDGGVTTVALSGAGALICAPFTVTGTPPSGVVGAPYTTTFNASGGSAPYSFTSTGSLPSGVSLSSGGTLSGVPTSAGTFVFDITATGSNSCTGVASFSVTVGFATAHSGLVISEFRFRGPEGANDEFVEIYNTTGSAVDVSGYKLLGSNNAGVNSTRATIPAGRAIPAHGHYLFANGAASGGYSGGAAPDQTYGTGVTDDGGVALAQPDSVIVDAVGASVGSMFKEGTPVTSLGASNLNRSYERKAGGFDGSSTDTDDNSSDFVLRNASNAENLSSPSTPSISVTPQSADLGTVAIGDAASETVTIANIGGGNVTLIAPFTLTGTTEFTSGAPASTSLSPGSSTTVIVTFTPTAVGARAALLEVRTSDGEVRSVALGGYGECGAITINGVLGGGQYGTPYSQSLSATGGLAPYAIGVNAGSLPNGLTLSNDGAVSGSPIAAGTFSFDVSATDANGCTVTAAYSIAVAKAPLSVSADNKAREFGAANPPLTGTLTGVIAGDNITADFTTAANAATAPGTYPIVASVIDPEGRLANYQVAATDGTLTVTDTTPPVLTTPANITLPSTDASGATVTYLVTAADAVDGARPVSCLPASGAAFTLGTTTVNCTASDTHGNSSSANFTVTVTDASVPGRMNGDGEIEIGGVRHSFDFTVRERSSGVEAGHLRYAAKTRQQGRDMVHEFTATDIAAVLFVNAPGTSPGRRPASGIDSARFIGVGNWDGASGFTFDAIATDAGEPGRGRDQFSITVRNAGGQIVATVTGTLTGGNLQSLRQK